MPKLLKVPAYVLAALLALCELAVLWVLLHPNVNDDYRAYYLDKTTTCLNQQVSGEYTLGNTIVFPDDMHGTTRPVRVCGWDGPAGDGLHSVGTTSRLRLLVPPDAGKLTLSMQVTAVELDNNPQQRIVLTGNGKAIGEATIPAGETRTLEFPLEAADYGGKLELTFEYPDAVRTMPREPDTRLRAIKLVSLRLAPAA